MERGRHLLPMRRLSPTKEHHPMSIAPQPTEHPPIDETRSQPIYLMANWATSASFGIVSGVNGISM